MQEQQSNEIVEALRVVSLLQQNSSKCNVPLIKLLVDDKKLLNESELRAITFLENLTPSSLFGFTDNQFKEEVQLEVHDLATEQDSEELLASQPSRVPCHALLESFINELTQREIRILQGRVLKDPSDSLDSIGHEFGITRERVRQIEVKLMRNLTDWFETDELVTEYSQEIRTFVGKINTLVELTNHMPGLNEIVNGLNLPAWYVFDKFDDSFESDGKWISCPSLKGVSNEFDQLFNETKFQENYMRFDQFQLLIAEWSETDTGAVVEWCLSRGYLLCNDLIIGPANHTLLSVAHAILAASEDPLSTEELWTLIPLARSTRSLANQLSEDPRFSRVGPGLWNLKDKSRSEYKGIRSEIESIILENGPTNIEFISNQLASRFLVSRSSVRTYASSWPFSITNDIVDFQESNTTPGRTFDRSRRCYALSDSEFVTRSIVNKDHLRGSGFTIPTGLAIKLGLSPGQTIVFQDVQTGADFPLRWSGLQPQMSSIRKPLITLGAREGDQFKLTFSDNLVSIKVLSADLIDPKEQLKFILSNEKVDQLTLSEVSRQLLTDDFSEVHIANLLEARGEEDLLALLCNIGLIRPALAPKVLTDINPVI